MSDKPNPPEIPDSSALRRLEAENAELRRALAPFATVNPHWPPSGIDRGQWLADVNRAYAVVSTPSPVADAMIRVVEAAERVETEVWLPGITRTMQLQDAAYKLRDALTALRQARETP